MAKKERARRGGRVARTIRSLLVMGSIGVVLIVYNAVTLHRDVGLATGPAGPDQERFFVTAADRPDIATFFKNLTHSQRMAMSADIGRYTDAPLAKLIGICLGDFDAEARQALTASLTKVAEAQPEAVAEQLNLKGSFQTLGVTQALDHVGPKAIPLVIKQLGNADARPNAVAFLASQGKAAISPLLPVLDDSNADVRLAAADALSKLGAREAVEPLVRKYQSSQGDEKAGYLTALSGIGDPRTENLLRQALLDPGLSVAVRAQAAQGLGRIGSDAAAKTLWSFADAEDAQIRGSAISGLQLARDAALKTPNQDPRARLQVASGIRSDLADQVIRDALGRSDMVLEACRDAAGRPELAPALQSVLARTDPNTQGDLADAAIRALAQSPEGVATLRKLPTDSPFAGFVARRLAGR